MVDNRTKFSNSVIFQELDSSKLSELFGRKQKKFIQNIDSFYYSVYLDADFTRDSCDSRVIKYRNYLNHCFTQLSIFGELVFQFADVPKYFNVKRCYYAECYDFLLDRPDHYRILFSHFTLNQTSPQVLVQLSSSGIWLQGLRRCLDESLRDVKKIVSGFNFKMLMCLENRVDYCWHTNYIQNPEYFLRSDVFAKMLVSRLKKESFTHESFYGNEAVEIDYRTLGKKSSNNIFFRIYHKSKEVIQMGYKAFFFKEWLCKGLISRYDFYCLESAYINRSWDSLDKCRLKFYLEHGSNENLKRICEDILTERTRWSYDMIHSFADMLAPPVTIILNVEYQTMRKFSASLELQETTHEYKKYGAASRLYAILDNWKAITNYLTLHSVRLVTSSGDENKVRRKDCPFWDALRRTKCIEMKYHRARDALLRKYTHEKNVEIVKKRGISNMVSWNLYMKGENEDDLGIQIVDFLSCLNDNDYAFAVSSKNKKLRRSDYSDPVGYDGSDRYLVIDTLTGEILDTKGTNDDEAEL